ncbi:MAG: type 4a pilus biogenesis protein PilO [Candidatus Pacebacteria bacterium]|nr:type 4a pilus biogenesis protein PilO [Candidatus Paceibacterota bacterium]
MSRYLTIISIVLIIVFALGAALLWWPKLQEILELRAELKLVNEEIKQREGYSAKLNTLNEKIREYPEELQKIDSAFPKEPSVPVLFNYIQKTSSENGLILDKISLGKMGLSSDTQGLGEISFSVSVSGSYSALKNFLSAMNKTSRLIDINSIGFSSPDKSDLFTFDISLKTYYYSETALPTAEQAQNVPEP